MGRDFSTVGRLYPQKLATKEVISLKINAVREYQTGMMLSFHAEEDKTAHGLFLNPIEGITSSYDVFHSGQYKELFSLPLSLSIRQPVQERRTKYSVEGDYSDNLLPDITPAIYNHREYVWW